MVDKLHVYNQLPEVSVFNRDTNVHVCTFVHQIYVFFFCSYAIPCVQKVLECKKVSNDSMKKKMFMGV